jgi:hypothetical protein
MSGVLHGVVASLKAAAAAATDAFFEYVTLLLNTTSTNGAQNNTFLDSSTNNFTVTRNGDVTQGSFNPYMPTGYWSGYFDGTGDYLSVPRNNAFLPGANTDFTVEAWVYMTATPGGTDAIIAGLGEYGTDSDWNFNVNSSRQLTFYINAITTSFTNTGTLVPLNTWTHVAASRSGTGTNNLKVFVNGVGQSFTTNSTTVGTGLRNLTIGADQNGDESNLTGYISNLRFVNGTGVYTADFTPPTTPLTAITNTSLLCLQDNRFIDNSSNAFAITVNGDTRISKFAPFNIPASYSTASYGGSGYFDGSGDYLSIASATALNLSSGDFTIEAWVYWSGSNANSTIFNKDGLIASSYPSYDMSLNGSGYIICYVGSGNGTSSLQSITSSTLLPSNTWVHLAFVKNSTTLTLYQNGVSVATATQTVTITDGGKALLVGYNAGQAAGYYFSGYISNARIVKGTAVYTAAFTPPTTPLTAISGTSLLCNFTNAGIYDAATINDGQTVGNAQVSTTQAKWGTTSMGFDGTGDYVTVIDKPELRLGTGDFTIEGWVYLNATGVAYGLVSKGTATTGWSVNVTSGNKLQFSYTATQLTGATSLVSGTWYYFAVVRSGTASGNLRVILDGATDATSAGAVNDNFNQTNVMYVGADRVAGAVLNGYLQDVRITNGYARTITTPTAAFPTL